MKIRNGFVSNSSSSSFLLAVKNKLPSTKRMWELLQVDPKSPGGKLLEPLVDHILEDAKPLDIKEEYIWDDKVTMENILNGDEGEEAKMAAELERDGWKIFRFSGSNDGSAAEMYLLYQSIDIKTDDVVIYGEGGY